MNGVSFESPQFLLLLVLVPFGIFLKHVWKKRGSVLRLSFSIYNSDSFKQKINFGGILYALTAVFFWIGIICFFIAIAGPVKISKDRVFLNRGIDIMVALDLSPSMAARDFKPDNRFESAKTVIKNFISTRENDPIGLVTFGSEGALRVPPTVDYDMLFDRLDSLKIMEQGKETAIGMGIAIAALHLKESAANEKIIILLTDGVNNAGDLMPESAAEIARKMNIRIYVVGIGTEDEVLLEYEDLDTGEEYRAWISQSYDEDLLRTIANISGGKFYKATSSNSLEIIFNTIDSAESYEKKVKVITYKEPLYKIFILIAFICLIADFLIRKTVLMEILP